MFRRGLRWVALGLAAGSALMSAAYLRDMRRAQTRVSSRSAVIASPYGDIEYVQRGSGPAVLVIHGSGGGYDQGELLAEAALGAHFRCIVPSRFGYLRSTFHEGATWDDQAHAYAYLLDRLGVRKVAVVALSHGGPSALLFGVLHPERVSSLVLISCGVAPSVSEDQAQANRKGDMLTLIYRHDPLYWALTKLFRRQFIALMGADAAVLSGLSREQRGLIDRVIDYMNPVSLRTAGVVFDNRAALPGARIAAITAPTLVLHATDDTLQLFSNAEFAASTIPGARLVRFERGGHLVLSVERDAIRAATQRHILDHAGTAG